MEFQDMFLTVIKRVLEYLCLVRWPDGFECPHCQCREAWELKRFILRCKNCRRDVSVTAGTIFQDRHMPLRVIFQAMWYVVCQKTRSKRARFAGHSWFRKLPYSMVVVTKTAYSNGTSWEGFTFWNSRG